MKIIETRPREIGFVLWGHCQNLLDDPRISPSGPVQTSFQVDIEIYEDNLDQSGDRILSSHVTRSVIERVIE